MRESPANRLELHWPKQAAPAPPPPVYEPQTVGEVATSVERRIEDFMGEHPKLTVAAAAALGLVLGWMVKRK
jgi:hypothetical protein